MEMPTPGPEHQWLQQLVGEWTFETECSMGPDQPPIKNAGRETVRSLGGFWTIGNGNSEDPAGGAWQSVMTPGYDPKAGRFVGTFIASMMTHLWRYTGSLDASSKVLTLDTMGPSMLSADQLVAYQDIIEFISDDHRILSSQARGTDGEWMHFMRAHYRRVG